MADAHDKKPDDEQSKKLPKALIPIYGIVFLDVLGFTILIPLFPSLAARYHVSPAIITVLLSVTAICATISSPFWGRFSDKIGRKGVLQISQCFSFVGYTLLALAPDVTWLFVSRVIEGFGGGNLGVAQSYIADVTAENQREKAFAYSAAAFGVGFVIGPALAGQLLRIGPTVPFWVAAAAQALMFVLTASFLPRTGEHEDEKGRAAQPNTRAIIEQLRKKPMLNLLGRQFLYIFSFVYFSRSSRCISNGCCTCRRKRRACCSPSPAVSARSSRCLRPTESSHGSAHMRFLRRRS